MADLPSRLATALADRYRLERELGAGGMATVYLAQDLRHDRQVAIKVLRPELAAALGSDRFLAEIRTTANLQHPNIVPLFDSGEADGVVYYVMPYVSGESLRARLEREGRFSVPTAITIARGVAQALATAHEAGVVHRDIKPENILLVRDQPIVADFGIARAVDQAGGERITATGMMVGTPAHMSPEQALGEATLDARSDLYSLGCVIYEMLEGCPPFSGGTVQALIAQRLVGPPPPLTSVPPAVNEVVRRSLATAPQDRFATALALAEALVAAASRPGPVQPLIVVLPFANQSPDPDNEFFADGLTEEIIGELSRVRGLRVISRNSAMALKGTRKDTPTLGRELHVSHVVTGSVRRAGNAVRVSAELVEAATDTPVWSDKYSGTLEDVFGIQEEIARKVVGALEVNLTPRERPRAAARPVNDVLAYDYYLRARREMYLWDPDSMARAEDLIRKALGIVGENPLLLAMLAQISWMYVNITIRPEESLLGEAAALVDRALALDPEHHLAIFVRGALAAQRGEVEAALRDVHRATELQPGDANVGLEMVRFLNGAGLPAERFMEATIQVDPLMPITWLARAFMCGMTGRFDQVRPAVDRMTALVPAISPLHIHGATYLAMTGEREAAVAMLAEAGAAFAGTPNGSWAMFLKCAYEEDAAGAARHLTPELLQAAALVDHNARSLAEGFALLGRTDDALRWIRIAVGRSIVSYPFLATHDTLLERIRPDARFHQLLGEVKPRWENLTRWSSPHL